MKRLVLLSVLLLAGCGLRESQVVGSYRGESAQPAQDTDLGKRIAGGLTRSMSIDLKQDHTFSMIALIVPVTGKWDLQGDVVTCTPTGVFGYDTTSDQSKPFQFKADGTHLEPVKNGNNANEDFHFVKLQS